ncbi:MAG TPA: hypothetical protein VKZ79_00260 [Alphaproteobacteria bacterium]|nr:hypothetical protein [Alphaproteobacteria bacterium]
MQQPVLAPPLERNPFRLSIGPDAAFLDGDWRRARDEALAAILGPPRLIFVTGEPGTGKSLLLMALADALKQRNRPALHIRRGEIPPPERDRAPLLVDEADRLDDDARERIVARSVSFPCVVAGTPGLPVQFGAAVRDAAMIELAPMAPDEVSGFLGDRLRRAGLPGDLFTDDGITALAFYSHGIPRVTAILASSAWMIAGASPETRINADHVVEAVTIRDGVPPAPLPAAASTEVKTAAAKQPAPRIVPTPETAPSTISEAQAEQRPVPQAVPISEVPVPIPEVATVPEARPAPEPTPEAVKEKPAPILEAPPLAAFSSLREPVFETNLRAPPPDHPVLPAPRAGITAPIHIPPRRRLSSIAARPFYLAAAATIFAVIGVTAFLERDRIDGALEALSTPSGGPAVETASMAPLTKSASLADQPATPQPSPAEKSDPAAPAASTNTQAEAARNVVVQVPATPSQQAKRVVVRYHRGDATARQRAATVAEELRQTGLYVDEPKPAERWIGHGRLQYFFDADRDAAAAIAAYLSPRFGVEEPGRPDPRDASIQPGTVEIWVPGTRPPHRRHRSFSEYAAGWFR